MQKARKEKNHTGRSERYSFCGTQYTNRLIFLPVQNVLSIIQGKVMEEQIFLGTGNKNKSKIFQCGTTLNQQKMRQIWMAVQTHNDCCITLIQNKYAILIYQINDLPRLTIPECPVGNIHNILFPPMYL